MILTVLLTSLTRWLGSTDVEVLVFARDSFPYHNKTMYRFCEPHLYVQGQLEFLFLEHNFHILTLIFILLDTSIHHNKMMCCLYGTGWYIQDQNAVCDFL